jgi:hypothetical protein
MSEMRCARPGGGLDQMGEVGCMKHPTTKDRQIPIMLRAYFAEHSVTVSQGTIWRGGGNRSLRRSGGR